MSAQIVIFTLPHIHIATLHLLSDFSVMFCRQSQAMLSQFIACVFQLLRHVLQTITGNMVNGQCADSDTGPLPDCCCNLDSTLGAFGAEQLIKDTCQIAVAIWTQPSVALVFKKEVWRG